MAYNPTIGFLSYDNSDLIRDGYIQSVIHRYYNVEDFDLNKLNNPRKGSIYFLEKDSDGNITGIIERRQLLPANHLKMELKFSKTMKSSVINPIDIETLVAFGSIGSGTVYSFGLSLLPAGTGSVTSAFTDIVFHICDAETKVNVPIVITEEIKETGIIELSGYPLSIYGVVNEFSEIIPAEKKKEDNTEDNTEDGKTEKEKYLEEHPQAIIDVDKDGNTIAKLGLDFTSVELEKIGQFSTVTYQGGPTKRVRGATNQSGQFGGAANAYIDIDNVLRSGQSNLFIEIVRDDRKYKFRGDNADATEVRYLPFKSRDKDDITDKKIRINTENLKVDDTVYITYSIAYKRHIRQAIRHNGKVGQGPHYGVVGWNAEIGSEIDIFDFQICNWVIPNFTPSNNAPDSDYKISLEEYLNKDLIDSSEKEKYFNDNFEYIEGWRLSNVITKKRAYYWAADYRGILLVSKYGTIVVFPASSIRDQDWFYDYLSTLDFVKKHTEDNGDVILDDIEYKIDEYIDIDNGEECFVDVSDATNSILFDREKIPYYRKFAIALQKIIPIDIERKYLGIGVAFLDIILNRLLNDFSLELEDSAQDTRVLIKINENFSNYLDFSDEELEVIDLSNIVFKWTKEVSSNSFSCDDFTISDSNYFCHTYDTDQGVGEYFPGYPSYDTDEGSGIFLSNNYIENSMKTWHAARYIESYWKLETPYYCGNFNRKSRIYIEYIGGTSVDNWSWIYVDTYPDIPDTISLFKNDRLDESYLVFYDSIFHRCVSYNIMQDNFIIQNFNNLEVDFNQKHDRSFLFEDIWDNQYKIELNKKMGEMGYNNFLDGVPSYSYGCPLNDDTSQVCHYEWKDFWKEVDFLNTETYAISREDGIIKVNNNNVNFALKELFIEGKIYNYDQSETSVTLFFERENAAISNLILHRSEKNKINKFSIDGKYYRSDVFYLIGDIWDNFKFTKFTGIVSEEEDFKKVKVNQTQFSVVCDGYGRIIIFYTEALSGNISVAITYNHTQTWFVYKDILRLIEGEVATLPVAIISQETNLIRLFYVLNDSFLMYISIDSDFFVEEDVFIDYVQKKKIDENSDDSDISVFSSPGQLLRKKASFFVVGSSDEDFFKEQMEITNKIKDGEGTSSIRFDFNGEESQMDDFFNGKTYAVHINESGVERLFYISDNKLSIKFSSNFLRWDYEARDVEIHKNFLSNRIDDTSVRNIQIIKNDYNNLIYLLYFNNGMLFMRVITTVSFKTIYSEEGVMDDSQTKEYLEISSSKNNRPIFLVGNIPDIIKNIRLKEIENNVVDSELAIEIPYDDEQIVKFDNNLEIDTDTQVYGYVMNNGILRIFYKDIFGNLNSIYVNGRTPIPEIFLKIKDV